MKRTDRGSKFIRASANEIYRAFVDPQALVRWLPPSGATGRLEVFEPRAGGAYRLRLRFNPSSHSAAGKTAEHEDVVEGTFVDLVPAERVVQRAVFDSKDPSFAGTMTITWIFTSVEGGTEVTVIAEDVPDGISQADHDAGLRSSLENLAAFVE